jgi:hypothetical protein
MTIVGVAGPAPTMPLLVAVVLLAAAVLLINQLTSYTAPSRPPMQPVPTIRHLVSISPLTTTLAGVHSHDRMPRRRRWRCAADGRGHLVRLLAWPSTAGLRCVDVRWLPNPFKSADFRDLSGLDAPVQRYLMTRDDVELWLACVVGTIAPLIRRGRAVQVAVGCTGGQAKPLLATRAGTRYLECWACPEMSPL